MRIKGVALSIGLAVLLSSASFAAEQSALKDEKAKNSYSLGFSFGANLANQKDVEIDKDVLVGAVRDALEGKKPALSLNEIRNAMKELQRKAAALQAERTREQAAKNLEEANRFLEANKKKEGITTLSSGLQYKVIKEGSGASPKATDGVRMRYRGTLTSGTEFDNTTDLKDEEVPMIPVSGAHKGWAEALQLMKPGSKWQLFVPPQLGFGDRQFGRVPANSVLIYEIELMSVVDRSAVDQLSSTAPDAAGSGNTDKAPGSEAK